MNKFISNIETKIIMYHSDLRNLQVIHDKYLNERILKHKYENKITKKYGYLQQNEKEEYNEYHKKLKNQGVKKDDTNSILKYHVRNCIGKSNHYRELNNLQSYINSIKENIEDINRDIFLINSKINKEKKWYIFYPTEEKNENKTRKLYIIKDSMEKFLLYYKSKLIFINKLIKVFNEIIDENKINKQKKIKDSLYILENNNLVQIQSLLNKYLINNKSLMVKNNLNEDLQSLKIYQNILDKNKKYSDNRTLKSSIQETINLIRKYQTKKNSINNITAVKPGTNTNSVKPI